ncbi:MAG: hypothetical protein IKY10_01425, partial [Clostridia bacterium]|nr:hypothetical protein [Clostridia bacterium]
ELIFSSVINPNVGDLKDRSVKVVVDYPFGDSLKISTSRTDLSKEVVSTQNIAKNTSKQYYVITSGNVLYDFDGDGIEEAYSYKTKENLNLQVLVKYYTADVSFKVADYVGISGQNGTETYDGGYKILTFTVDYKTPLTISVLKQIENQATKDYAFELELRPYVTIKQENIFYPAQNKQFNLSTLEGVSKISFSYDEAVVYPNDTVYLTSHIVTDDKIINVADILKLIRIKNVGDYKYDFVVDKYVITKISTNQEIGSFVVNVDEFSHYENNIQTVVFRIEFDDLILSGEAILEINAIATSGIETIVLDKVLYNIIPQRINKLEIKNFYYKNAQLESEMVLENVLKPDNAGKMQIDIVPDKGYYSYLEISDITGDEEILFIEIDENGNALTLHSDPSSDNKGIKIYNNENLNKKRIYVRTQIDRNYSSKIHTVEVRAYSNNGTLLYSQTIEIDVKMMPEITVDYLLPNGSVGQTISTKQGYNNSGNILLANGVDAKFMIVTENANSDLEYQMFAYDASGDEDKSLLAKYSFRQDVGNHYVLDRNDETPDLSDVGKTIRINFIIFSYLDNGDFNKAECYVEFEIVPFVLHSVSVSNSIDNLEKQEIYGYFDKPIKLNFYFDKHDISFYDTQTENEPFWDTVYSYEERKELDNAGTLGFIYSILRDLNAYEYNAVTTTYTILEENKYLILNDNSIVDDSYTFDVSNIKQIALKNNQLEVKYDKDEDYNPKYLAVAFKVYYDTNNNVWEIDEYNKE